MDGNNSYIESNSTSNNDFKFFDNDNDSKSKDDDLYMDGEEKRPKFVLIIGGILLLLIIVMIVFLSCGKKEKSSNSNLGSLSVTGGELSPEFDKTNLVYNVYATNDAVTITCAADDSKASIEGCNQRIKVEDTCIEHLVTVKAQNGTKNEYTLNICKKNENAPVIDSVTISPEGYSKSSVTVTVNATALENKTIQNYSFDGGSTFQTSNKITISENKSLSILVVDSDGIKSQIVNKDINNIDTTQPKVTITGNVKSGVQTKNPVNLTSTISPENTKSGYSYQWYKGGSKISGATNASYKATSSGTYKLVVTTGAKISSTSNEYVVKIESGSNNNEPVATMEISSVTGNATSWTSENVTLKVNVKSTNGIANEGYSFDGGKTFQKSNTKTFDSNQTVNIVVKDKKNIKDSTTVAITKIDKTKPTISITGNSTTGSTLTVNVNPSTNASGYTYQWTYNGSNYSTAKTITASKAGNYTVTVKTGAGISSSASKTITNPVKPTVTITAKTSSGNTYSQGTTSKENLTLSFTINNGTALSYTWYKDNTAVGNNKTYTATSSGNYKVIVNTSSGNITSNTVNVVINKSTPKITIDTRLGSYYGNKYTPDTWTNKDVYITVNVSDYTDIYWMYFQYNNGDTTWYGDPTRAWTTMTVDSSKGTGKATIIFRESTDFKVKVINKSGQEIFSEKINIKIDKEAPYTPYISSSSYKMECQDLKGNSISTGEKKTIDMLCYFNSKSKFKFTITQSDDKSGIDYCEYANVNNSESSDLGNFTYDTVNYKFLNQDTVKWSKNNSNMEFSGSGYSDKVILRRCYDKAGNMSKTLLVWGLGY